MATHRIAFIELDPGYCIPCLCASDLAIGVGDQCVIEHERVQDFGHVLKVEGREGDATAELARSKVLRRSTLQDQARHHENQLVSKMARETCGQKAAKFKLNMHLVRVRYNFDRSILSVVFTSEERLDFWPMVKELGAELKTRVDMRQIGVRDEARLVGGIGPCGRCLCCCSWLKEFDSINVRMAKTQRLSLNPGAISGHCGRLKCCLKYEVELYQEMGRDVPREGAVVQCQCGKGVVVDANILAQKVTVRFDDDRQQTFKPDEVRLVNGQRQKPGRQRDEEDPHPEWAKSESPRKT